VKRDGIEQSVIAIVGRQTSIPVSKLSLSDRLLQDLGVDGDDATELLMKFCGAFDVDIGSLQMKRHFRSEPNLLSVFSTTAAKSRELAEKVPVTIRDLVEAAKTGRWPI
jgi:acyl carrier protein